jgi:predicted MFS family arabinose efflux permease
LPFSRLSALQQSTLSVGSNAMVADLISSEKRLDAYALMRLSNNAGISIGPVIGGFISTLSFNLTFYLAAAGMIIYSLLMVFFSHETLVKTIGNQVVERKPLGGYLQVVKDKKIPAFYRLFILAQMCATMIWMCAVYASLFNVPERLYGYSATNASWLFSYNYMLHPSLRYNPYIMAIGTVTTLGVSSVALGHSLSDFG